MHVNVNEHDKEKVNVSANAKVVVNVHVNVELLELDQVTVDLRFVRRYIKIKTHVQLLIGSCICLDSLSVNVSLCRVLLFGPPSTRSIMKTAPNKGGTWKGDVNILVDTLQETCPTTPVLQNTKRCVLCSCVKGNQKVPFKKRRLTISS